MTPDILAESVLQENNQVIQITEKGDPIDESDIIAVEEVIGAGLVEPYRSFLKNNNGGRPKPDVIDLSEGSYNYTDIKIFFGINDEIESCNILWRYKILCRDLSRRDLISIACDSGGNEFCLITSGEDAGKIFYYAYDIDPVEFSFVSNNFDEFLEKIREFK